jgi:hypothetical protein
VTTGLRLAGRHLVRNPAPPRWTRALDPGHSELHKIHGKRFPLIEDGNRIAIEAR